MTHRLSGRRAERPAPRSGAGPMAAPPTSRWSVLAVIGAAQLMVVLDITIVNIALPSAQDELGFDIASRQWVITAYSLAFGSLLLLGGRLSDRVGVRRTLVIGLIGFAAASALGGAAGGFAVLIAARAAQGVFAAVLAPAALSTLNITFTDPDDRAKAFAVFSAIAASGAVLGLLLGGAVTEWLSWRWCLYINMALALPAALGAIFFVRAAPSQSRVGLDWPGAVTASAGLFCLVYGLSTAESDGWSAPLTVVMLSASAVLIVAFVVLEMRVPAPLLPLQIVTDRNRGGAYLTIAVTFCAMFAAFLFLTYFMQRDLRYSPLATGVAFLPMAAGIGLAAGLANTVLMRRYGPRPLIPTGMLLAAAGMAWLGQLGVDATYTRDILGPIVLLGVGMGMAFSPAVATATSGVATQDAGVASAMVNTSQQIGGTIGTAALSTIFTTALARYMDNHQPPTSAVAAAGAIHGYTVAFHTASALFVAGAILTALILRGGRLQDGDTAREAVSDSPRIV
jgi:EmrB/QacA subfamily drug resistance transporter